ncbi:MAG: hypothetical protein Q4B52_06505 [Tissierellia bacterium]|nr:hypothetical protein [Tissierellia bacterium]
MNRFKDLVIVTKEAILNTIFSLKNSYMLLLLIAIMTVFEFLRNIIGGNMIISIIGYLISIAILSLVAGVLDSIINYNSSGKNTLKESYRRYFSPLINVMFIIYLVQYLLYMVLQMANLNYIYTLIFIVAFKILISPALEMVYIRGYYGYGILFECFNFIAENILTWIPYALVFSIFDYILLKKISFLYAMTNFNTSLVYVLILTLFRLFIYLFKGYLFKELSENSYRKRMFKRSF